MKNRPDFQIRRIMKKYNIILGELLSASGHIYDITAIDGQKTDDRCCKVFIGCTQGEAISEYTIGRLCYEEDDRHFMKVYDLVPFTIKDDIFDNREKNCWAMIMEKGVPFTIVSEPKYVSFYIRFLTDITQAIYTLHRLNFVHFDIKPDNIVINKNGNFCLIDFGISKAIDDGTINIYDISGSRCYMAPEVFRAELSRQADIYSLGTTVRSILLNGVHEFDTYGKSIKQLCQLKKNLEPLRSEDGYVQQFLDIVNKMSAYDPAERYADVEEILKELAGFTVRRDIRLYTAGKYDNRH